MTGVRIFITGMGVVSPLGSGVAETRVALAAGRCHLGPLSLFETPDNAPLPVGQIRIPLGMQDIPRTHQLARMAADQAMANCREAPDAVVVGTTTGGMRTTEDLLKEGVDDPAAYRWHAAGSVAEDIADRVGCKGAVLTVSTACSSGAVALKIGVGNVEDRKGPPGPRRWGRLSVSPDLLWILRPQAYRPAWRTAL